MTRRSDCSYISNWSQRPVDILGLVRSGHGRATDPSNRMSGGFLADSIALIGLDQCSRIVILYFIITSGDGILAFAIIIMIKVL